jgi:hypothetical protein
MKLHEVKPLNEAVYPGNVGMMEMFKFYQEATSAQKDLMQDLISKKAWDAIFDLIYKVTGVKLQK